jgi:outer membrane receptor protein involved in Fe transport
LLGVFNLFDQVDSSDKQLAGFGSVDVKPIDNLKITLGLRVTRSTFDFIEVRDGPVNSGVRTTTGSGQKATAVTPKFGVSYQLDTNNMVYASASKGFRPGGAQSPVDPTFCAADLATLGLKGSPTSYKSDSLWSYEAGAKNKLLGGMLVLDVNVYLVKWKNIQQAIRLPRCSFDFIGNLGNATGKGTDISISVRPFSGLSLGANIGYNHTTYDQNVLGGNGVVIRQKGDHIGAASLTGSIFTQFDHELSSSMSGYMRADYSFQNKGIRANPNVSSYDPGLPGLPATSNLSMRAGIKMGGIDLSAFVNNLTNSNDPLSRGHDTIGSPLYYVETYRPRTFGVTAQFRY